MLPSPESLLLLRCNLSRSGLKESLKISRILFSFRITVFKPGNKKEPLDICEIKLPVRSTFFNCRRPESEPPSMDVILLIPPSHTRIFLTSPYGSPTRSPSQASVNNSLVSANSSSQLATTRRHS